MRPKTKWFLVAGAVLLCAVVVETMREQYAPITEKYAHEAAQTEFEHLCRDFHLHSSDYEPPVSTSVGGADFAYQWKSKRPGVQTVLISVARGGIVEPAWIDEAK
jgi:hypothetical protein